MKSTIIYYYKIVLVLRTTTYLARFYIKEIIKNNKQFFEVANLKVMNELPALLVGTTHKKVFKHFVSS